MLQAHPPPPRGADRGSTDSEYTVLADAAEHRQAVGPSPDSPSTPCIGFWLCETTVRSFPYPDLPEQGWHLTGRESGSPPSSVRLSAQAGCSTCRWGAQAFPE